MVKRITTTVALFGIMCSYSLQAYAISKAKQIDIPPEYLVPALQAFQRQAAVNLVYDPNQLRIFRTNGVRGIYEARAALRVLLKGTPLTLQRDQSGAFAVVDGSGNSGSRVFSSGESERENVSGSPSDPPALPHGSADGNSTQLQTIIVTAQKVAQNLLYVPVPVSVINATPLIETGQLGLENFFNQVPGLSAVPSQYGAPQVSIRGISTGGFVNPTVGITIDDVPVGSTSAIASGQEVTDIDPGDLQNIEVLRGPQGTLYGASSLGGLIKYVTVDPSLNSVSGQVEVDTENVYSGGSLGYSVRGAANIPLSKTMAIYGSTFYREDPGYIDDVLTGQTHVDEAWDEGGFFKALWEPSDALSLRLTALVEHYWSDGVSLAYSGLGDLQQSVVRGAGAHSRSQEFYTATLHANLGSVDLTSVTGYSIRRFYELEDETSLFGPSTQQQFGVTGTPISATGRTYRFTQEFRLNGTVGPRVDWLLGTYYDQQNSPANGGIYATTDTGQVVGQWVEFNYPSTYKEIAGFGDLTFHFTNRLDLQLGTRVSTNRQTYSEYDVGQYYDPLFEGTASPFFFPTIHTKDTSVTYLATPKFKLSSDSMVYVRVASGYGPGGPNEQSSVSLVPVEYKPQKTVDYEIGEKSEVLDHRLLLDASLYYIQWRNLQLQLTNPITGIFFYSNGSAAKSQGLELSAQAKPLRGMSIRAFVAWNDAKLTEPLPPASAAVGAAGERLPYSEPFSGNLSLKQTFPLTGVLRDATAFVGGSVSYVGTRLGTFSSVFTSPPVRQDLPAYTEVDLRGGVDYDTWKVNLYIDNVTDKRGVLDGGLDMIPTNAYYYIRPRTIGVTISKAF